MMMAGCVAGAALLLVLTFVQGGKEDERAEGWIPLNEAVQEKITMLHTMPEETKSDGLQQEKPKAAQAAERTAVQPQAGTESADPEEEQAAGPDGSRQEWSGTEESAAGASVETPAVASGKNAGKLDINRATAEQLDALKGIGPSKAQAIVDDRERYGYFASVDDLLRVKGIGEKLLASLKESVVANP